MQSFWYLILYKWWNLSPKARYELLFDTEKHPTGTIWGLFFAGVIGAFFSLFALANPFEGFHLHNPLPEPPPFSWLEVFGECLFLIVIFEIGFNCWGVFSWGIAIGYALTVANLNKVSYWWNVSVCNLIFALGIGLSNPEALGLAAFQLAIQAICFIICKIFEPILYRKMQLFKPEPQFFDANQSDVLDEHFANKNNE